MAVVVAQTKREEAQVLSAELVRPRPPWTVVKKPTLLEPA
jgi:hypothetical protein